MSDQNFGLNGWIVIIDEIACQYSFFVCLFIFECYFREFVLEISNAEERVSLKLKKPWTAAFLRRRNLEYNERHKK